MTPSTEPAARGVAATAALLPASRLARLLGKLPSEWTLDDLVNLCGQIGVRMVSLMHVGGDGTLKTLDFVPSDEKHLREILTAGERADGSSVFPGMGVPVGASDIVLRPRLSTAFLDPFSPHPTLAVLAAHHGRDGRPLPQSPTTIVQRAWERLRAEMGVDLHALGEVEYFVGRRPEEHDLHASADRGYHATSPFVFGETTRRQALVLLAEIGVPIKYGHSECGHINADEVDARVWEQHEIELALQPLPLAADSVLLTQWVLRNLARQQGLRCSFEPVLRKGHAGSGMHFHLSPVVGGVHQRVTAAAGDIAPEARWLIGGLVTTAGALMAFGNRAPSSFLRLSQAKEAPESITWGRFNRKALVRLPIVATDEKGRPVGPETVEFRLPDGSAHPHLVLAGVAQAMLRGRDAEDLEEVLEATAATEGELPRRFSVPRSFVEVSAELAKARADLENGDVFPPAYLEKMVESLATQR
ncbi:MAG: glutamine synthetase beta-grasp domain-containing protein [Vicinamibacterales bacterium]